MSSKRQRRNQIDMTPQTLTPEQAAAAGYGVDFNVPVSGTSSQGLVKQPDGTLKYKGFQLTNTSLTAPDGVTPEQLDEIGEQLTTMHKSVAWWIGDWANLYPGRHGEKYTELAERFGLQETTVKQYAWVCGAVNLSNRLDELSFSHHIEVASLPDELRPQMHQLLEYARDQGLSVRKFRTYIAELQSQSAPSEQLETMRESVDRQFQLTLRLARQAVSGDARARQATLSELDRLREIIANLPSKDD